MKCVHVLGRVVLNLFLFSIELFLQHSLSCALQAAASMRYRTLRVASELQVVRLLTVAATASPSQEDLTKTLLRLDVESSRVSHLALRF